MTYIYIYVKLREEGLEAEKGENDMKLIKKALFVTVSCEIACTLLLWGMFHAGAFAYIARVLSLTWMSAVVYANWDVIY